MRGPRAGNIALASAPLQAGGSRQAITRCRLQDEAARRRQSGRLRAGRSLRAPQPFRRGMDASSMGGEHSAVICRTSSRSLSPRREFVIGAAVLVLAHCHPRTPRAGSNRIRRRLSRPA
jgi:hypothetical protein